MSTCDHISTISGEQYNRLPASDSCEECRKLGQQPVQRRMCLTCGHVGCCDSTPGQHATAHFKETQHPVMRSIEPGGGWMWCYVHEVMGRPTLES